MADYGLPVTKFPSLVKMLGGKAIIILAIVTDGQLYKVLMLLCVILLIICWPFRKKQIKTKDNKI